MHTSKKIHFEISERKVLLRFMDVLFVLAVLLGIGQLFQFTYFLEYIKYISNIQFLSIYIECFPSTFLLILSLVLFSNHNNAVSKCVRTIEFSLQGNLLFK